MCVNNHDEMEMDNREKSYNNTLLRTMKPSRIVDFQINYNDNCFTAIMKAIDRVDLIDYCRGSLHVFMNTYRNKLRDLSDKHNISEDEIVSYGNYNIYRKQLTRGHIIVGNNDIKYGDLFRSKYSLEYGIVSEDIGVMSNGHMLLCIDPDKNLFLHMKYYSGDRLILSLHEMDLLYYYKQNIVILDDLIIAEMNNCE